MENLFLPILVVVILAIAAVVNYVDGKPERKERVLKIIGKALILVVATVTISILFGGILYGAFAEEEIPWQHAEANGSIEVTLDGETQYFVVFTTEDGNVLSYFDDTEIVKGTQLKVKVSPYGETLDAEKEEPDKFWFPPILMLGAVAPIVKQTKKSIVRVQKMPVEKEKGRTKQDFRLPVGLESKQTTFVYYEGLLRKSVAVESVEKGLQLIKRATDKNYPAYLTAFVPAYNQQAVVATNWLGDLEYWFKTSIYFRVKEAYELLCADDVKTVLKVKYSQNGKKLYHFYPLGDVEIGNFVNVEKVDSFGKKQYKNVQVVDVCKMTKEAIEDLERRENMKIATIHCKYAIDLPECWANWGGSDPRISADEEPQDYDFEADIGAPSEEEIADFQAMREAYGYRLP